MTPVSESLLIDRMDYMAGFSDNFFDYAVCDPEYGLRASAPHRKTDTVKQKNGNQLKVVAPDYGKKQWDWKQPAPEYFYEVKRVSKRQIVFGGNYFGLAGGYLVWDKLNHDSNQYDAELAWLSWTKEVRTVYYMWAGMMQGRACSWNVREALTQQGDKSRNEIRIHPTQKPVLLYDFILKQYLEPGMKILDPGTGSQSLRIAAWKRGLDFWGCENDADMYAEAEARFKREIAMPLFDIINTKT